MAGPDAYGYDDGAGAFQYQVSLVFVDDEAYRVYLDQLGLNADEYFDASHPKALAYNETGHNDGVGYANLHEYAGTGTVSLLAYDLPAEAFARGPLYEACMQTTDCMLQARSRAVFGRWLCRITNTLVPPMRTFLPRVRGQTRRLESLIRARP